MKAKIDRRRFIVGTTAGGVTLRLVTAGAQARQRGQQRSSQAAASAGQGSLVDLHRAVEETLANGRIGRPLFVRYSLQRLDPRRRLVDGVAALSGAAIRWVGGPLDLVIAVGSENVGQLSATLVFDTGESAAVTCGRAPGPGSGVDLMIVGSRGAIYHDGGTSVLWPAGVTDTGAGEPRLVEAIARSLASGRAEPGT
jgi:predicted dehydrogenase